MCASSCYCMHTHFGRGLTVVNFYSAALLFWSEKGHGLFLRVDWPIWWRGRPEEWSFYNMLWNKFFLVTTKPDAICDNIFPLDRECPNSWRARHLPENLADNSMQCTLRLNCRRFPEFVRRNKKHTKSEKCRITASGRTSTYWWSIGLIGESKLCQPQNSGENLLSPLFEDGSTSETFWK